MKQMRTKKIETGKNKKRKLIRSMKLPAGTDAKALAESLTDEFAVAAISGSGGEFEVSFVSPEELVVVVGATQAKFFVEPLPLNAQADEEDEDERDDPDDVAEEISFHFERRTGLAKDEDDDDDDEKAPDDDSDDVARRMIQRLLDEGLLEIVNSRSRAGVEGYLAHKIAHGQTGESLGDNLADVKGVAELYASNEQLAQILADCRKKPGSGTKTQGSAKPKTKKK